MLPSERAAFKMGTLIENCLYICCLCYVLYATPSWMDVIFKKLFDLYNILYTPYVKSPALFWTSRRFPASTVLHLGKLFWIHSHSPFFLSWTNPSYFPENCLEWVSGEVLLLDGRTHLSFQCGNAYYSVRRLNRIIVNQFYFKFYSLFKFLAANCVITGTCKGPHDSVSFFLSHPRVCLGSCSETELSKINIFLHFVSLLLPKSLKKTNKKTGLKPFTNTRV